MSCRYNMVATAGQAKGGCWCYWNKDFILKVPVSPNSFREDLVWAAPVPEVFLHVELDKSGIWSEKPQVWGRISNTTEIYLLTRSGKFFGSLEHIGTSSTVFCSADSQNKPSRTSKKEIHLDKRKLHLLHYKSLKLELSLNLGFQFFNKRSQFPFCSLAL